MRYIKCFAKHQLLKGDKIIIASKEILRDNRIVHPFVNNEMLKYADQVHTLKSEPKDVVYLTNTQNWVWGPTFFRNLIIRNYSRFFNVWLKRFIFLVRRNIYKYVRKGIVVSLRSNCLVVFNIVQIVLFILVQVEYIYELYIE